MGHMKAYDWAGRLACSLPVTVTTAREAAMMARRIQAVGSPPVLTVSTGRSPGPAQAGVSGKVPGFLEEGAAEESMSRSVSPWGPGEWAAGQPRVSAARSRMNRDHLFAR